MKGPERKDRSEPPEKSSEGGTDTDESHGGNVSLGGVRDPTLQEVIPACAEIADDPDIVSDNEICPKRRENSYDRREHHRDN